MINPPQPLGRHRMSILGLCGRKGRSAPVFIHMLASNLGASTFDFASVTARNQRSARKWLRGGGHPLVFAALALTPLSFTACGASDEEQVAETVKRFYRATAEGDGEEACDQLTDSARGAAGPGQCEAAIEQMGELGGAGTKRRFEAVAVRGTAVRDNQATTNAILPGQSPVALRLRQVDGDWKLESLGFESGGSI